MTGFRAVFNLKIPYPHKITSLHGSARRIHADSHCSLPERHSNSLHHNIAATNRGLSLKSAPVGISGRHALVIIAEAAVQIVPISAWSSSSSFCRVVYLAAISSYFCSHWSRSCSRACTFRSK